jgi:hypothetical protein
MDAHDSPASSTEKGWRDELADAGRSLLKMKLPEAAGAIWRAALSLYQTEPRVFGIISFGLIGIVVGSRALGFDVLYPVPTVFSAPALLQVSGVSAPLWVGRSSNYRACVGAALSRSRPYVILNIVDHISFELADLVSFPKNSVQLVDLNEPIPLNDGYFKAENVSLATSGRATTPQPVVHVKRRIFYTILPLRDIKEDERIFPEEYSAGRSRNVVTGYPIRWYGPYTETDIFGSRQYNVQMTGTAGVPITIWTGADIGYILPYTPTTAFDKTVTVSGNQDFFDYPNNDSDVICTFTMAVESSTFNISGVVAHHMLPGHTGDHVEGDKAEISRSSSQMCSNSSALATWKNVMPSEEVGFVFTFLTWQQVLNGTDYGQRLNAHAKAACESR